LMWNITTKGRKKYFFKILPGSKARNNCFFNSILIRLPGCLNLFFHMVFTTFLRVWFVLYLYLKELI